MGGGSRNLQRRGIEDVTFSAVYYNEYFISVFKQGKVQNQERISELP